MRQRFSSRLVNVKPHISELMYTRSTSASRPVISSRRTSASNSSIPCQAAASLRIDGSMYSGGEGYSNSASALGALFRTLAIALPVHQSRFDQPLHHGHVFFAQLVAAVPDLHRLGTGKQLLQLKTAAGIAGEFFEQIARLHAQLLGKTVKKLHRRAAAVALKRLNINAAHLGDVGQLLLRHLARFAKCTDTKSKGHLTTSCCKSLPELYYKYFLLTSTLKRQTDV